MKIEIEITDEDAALIREFLDWQQADGDTNTHGPLTPEKLAGMLLEDVALVVRRPGSWEGANMSIVLGSHGYSV